MDFTASSAIVTGGASGLGEATVDALADRGARVVVVDRDEQRAKEVATRVDGIAVAGDVVDEEIAASAVQAASGQAPLRVLVNCAGLSRAARVVGRDGELFDMARFEFVLRVNVLGSFNFVRHAAAAMRTVDPAPDGDRAVIINTASVAAFDGQIGQAAYSASKGAVVAMTLPLARDLASWGIRVNTIAPGLFDTPIYGSGEAADAFKSKLGQSVVHPQRLGHATEFAALAVAIAENSYFNGETVRLDGAIRLPPR